MPDEATTTASLSWAGHYIWAGLGPIGRVRKFRFDRKAPRQLVLRLAARGTSRQVEAHLISRVTHSQTSATYVHAMKCNEYPPPPPVRPLLLLHLTPPLRACAANWPGQAAFMSATASLQAACASLSVPASATCDRGTRRECRRVELYRACLVRCI